jgi:prepilin-type N-terminal cleavage/methylation domain-containing protein
MSSTLSIPRSNAERGFTLVELLVASTVMLTALAAGGAFFVSTRDTIQDQMIQIETTQGLRAALDSMVRDLRLGGACLPVTGNFIVLDAVNGTTDQVVTRTGLVRPNQTCVRTVLTADVTASTSMLPVQSASGFQANMRVYINNGSNTSGEIVSLTAVDTTGNTLTKSTALSQDYLAGSGVYAVDERAYAIDTTNPSLPVLTLAINGATPIPFSYGIENMQVQYQLARNCATSCDVVDLPADDSEFALVNQIFFTLSARSRTTQRNGQYFRISRTVSAKPRNLLPN